MRRLNDIEIVLFRSELINNPYLAHLKGCGVRVKHIGLHTMSIWDKAMKRARALDRRAFTAAVADLGDCDLTENDFRENQTEAMMTVLRSCVTGFVQADGTVVEDHVFDELERTGALAPAYAAALSVQLVSHEDIFTTGASDMEPVGST